MANEKPPFIVALGEVLWDIFPNGRKLGGAPANFAVHCASLGANVGLVSCVGDDDPGRSATEGLRSLGVDVSWVGVAPQRNTGTVQVTLNESEPTYEIVEGVAWDFIDWRDEYEALAKTVNAICFGSLGQRSSVSRSTIQRFVDLTGQGCLRVLDINFRQDFHDTDVVQQSLSLANVLKLNADEVSTLRTYLNGAQDDVAFLNDLRVRFGLKLVIQTRGASGSCVYAGGEPILVPGVSQDVVNTVGAGDAFTAAFVCHYLAGHDVRACAQVGNEVGGFVTTQDSATPALPEHHRIWRNDANR